MNKYIIIGTLVLIVLLVLAFFITMKVKKLKFGETISLFSDVVEKIIGDGKGKEKFHLMLQILFYYISTLIKNPLLKTAFKIIFNVKKIEDITSKEVSLKQATGVYNSTYNISDLDLSALTKKNYIEGYAESDLEDFFQKNNTKIGVKLGRKF